MARTDTLNNFLTDVADSIRTKKGTTDAILASNFDTEIESIETGGGEPNLQSKSITITENGTQNVTADEGYDGLSDVSVTTNVQSQTTNKIYLIKNGIAQTNYEYVRTDATGVSGSFTENYNNEGYAYVTSKTWSEYHLNFINYTNIKAGSKIYVTFKKPKAFTGTYSEYGGGELIANFENTGEEIIYGFVKTNESIETIKTSLLEITSNVYNFYVRFANMAYTSSYAEYGICIYDLWIETDSTPNLQSKSITITENGTQNVTADEGYDGLSDVEVIANVPSVEMFTIPDCQYLFQDNYRNNVIDKLLPFCSGTSNCSRMFNNCSKLTSLDLSNFDTSNVTNITYMFNSCNSLTSLDISNFNTSKVTSMISMFYNCIKLTSLDLSNFNTSNVTNMSDMFNGCNSLTSLDLSNFDTSKVTNIAYMFNNCKLLTSLDLSNFDTSKVNNLVSMFGSCSSLLTLDLSSFNTSKVTSMAYMFTGCQKLTTLDLSNFNTSLLTNMAYTFYNCYNLKTLDLSSFDFTKVTNFGYMFKDCGTKTETGLTTVYVKDETAQNWILTKSNGKPSTWSTENVIIKGSNPSYTQLTYIQSSGTQRINTGVIATPDIGFEIDFETSDSFDSSSRARNILGCRNASYYWQDAYQLSTYTTTSDGDVGGVFAFGSTSSNTTYKNIKISANMSQNTRMTISFKNNVFTDALGNKTTLESSTIDANMPIYLFCLYNNNYSEFSNVKLYSCKFYNGDVLIRDFIPVIRNTDNSVCLYDKVNDIFYTNSGTGTFSGE